MIEVNNLTAVPLDEAFLKKIASLVLEEEGIEEEPILSLAFVGPGRMRQINKQYRGKNRVTDVLSFGESKTSFAKFKIGPLEKTKGLGEIIICPREAAKAAKRTDSSFEKEIITYLIHGLLHLLGYDHEKSETEAVRMENKQNYYLNKALKE